MAKINNNQVEPIRIDRNPEIVLNGRKNGELFGKHERGKALRQIIAAFVANLGTINTGLVFGFSAVVVPQLRQPDSSIRINENQASWVGT